MSRTLVSISLFSLMLSFACKSEGTIPGDLTPASSQPTDATAATKSDEQPAVKHERVSFSWKAAGQDHSGTIETTLPDGEKFQGQYHEIVSTTRVETLDGFTRSWYGDPWMDWTWGGTWPYHATTEDYIAYYTNQVVALLEGDRGTNMRCRFKVDDASRGLKGGGEGECQLSNGDRITAVFAAS